ncbi:MAG TPA: pseudouridine synthase [Bryobacteraceae bacterium]|nr:pseudouridine synthase [Bryobacteraceae bacterium]
MRPLKTLERVFSKTGIGSRSDARGWIAGGRVRVNGKIATNPDQWVDFAKDRITFDGRPLRAAKPTYILLYKPKGYLTTWRDPDGRPTIYELTKDVGTWLSPVGRLDLDTSGLLLLTNDTAFADHVTDPDHKVAKTYQVKAATLLSDDQIEKLRRGVELSDGPTRPAAVQRLRDGPKHTHLEITITEGRNRQVRRMLEAIDSKVSKLVRTAIGPIRIGHMTIGKWRPLSDEEVALLGGRERRARGRHSELEYQRMPTKGA